jgi:FkbM family methyltransferase
MQRDLIFDVGMHDGADTDFYLRKGFRVVAVEADSQLVAAAQSRFAAALGEGRLTIVNRAVAQKPGRITFYRSENTIWSTIDSGRAQAVARRGSPNEPVEVEAVTSASLLAEFGVPYYMKIDIEGMDTIAVAGLRDSAERPLYISIEAERRDLHTCREELALLAALGYHSFKVVPQHLVQFQREPSPPAEGLAADAPIAESSGLFGRDLPGAWLDEAEALDAFRRPLFNHYLTGTDALVKGRWLRASLKRLGFRTGWYDIHARHSGA